MKPLPRTLEWIVRTKPFRPSSMAFADHCLLAAVLPSCEQDWEKLKPTPIMVFGSAYHRLFELIVKGHLSIENRQSISSTFDELLMQFERKNNSFIKEALGDTRFERMRLTALRKAESISPDPNYGSGQKTRSIPADSGIKPGPERHIASSELELEGKCDRIIFNSGLEITIVDYKWSTPGHVSANHSVDDFIQLELYGLAILKQIPKARISLRIEGTDGEDEREFTKAQISSRQQWLQQIRTKVPLGTPTKAEEIARAGAHCFRCNHRHVCRTYMKEAPIAWAKKALPAPWPYDAWGKLESVATFNGLFELQIKGEGESYFRITGLAPSHFKTCESWKESKYYLFGLQPYPLGRGASHHPDNFYESPPYRGYPRAWTTEVFVEK